MDAADLDLLESISEFLSEQADSEYFTDSASPIPNDAMRLWKELEFLRGRLSKVS